MGELNIYGVYVPMLLIQAVLAYVVLMIIRKWIDIGVEKGWIALPSIFYLCLYVVLLGGVHWAFLES